MGGMGLPDALEERSFLRHAVHRPVGVEGLVAAVFRVQLREHHEFGIAGIAPEPPIGRVEVIDLVRGQGETEPRVRGHEGVAPLAQESYAHQRPRLRRDENPLGLRGVQPHRLGHPIVERRGECEQRFRARLCPCIEDPEGRAFDAPDLGQAAVVQNIRGLARPRRDGAGARRDEQGGRRTGGLERRAEDRHQPLA